MTPPRWIGVPVVLAIHEEQLARHGGRSLIQDESLIETALAHPRYLFTSEGPNILRLCAAYAAGLVWNRPFVAGNKRTSFVVAATFLLDNGYEITATEAEVVIATRALADRELTEEQFTLWLWDHTAELESGPVNHGT